MVAGREALDVRRIAQTIEAATDDAAAGPSDTAAAAAAESVS